jgi:hypothetical protein
VADRCRVEVEDFFTRLEPEGFDRVTSIGAAEHVPGKPLCGIFPASLRVPASGRPISPSRDQPYAERARAARPFV